MTDSRDIATIFGKEHYNVLAKIRDCRCSEGFRRLNFQAFKIKDLTGESTSHVLMTRDGFTFLAMGFTGADGRLVTDSRNVAEVTGKEHKHVLETIDRLRVEVQDHGRIFDHEYFQEVSSDHPTVPGRSIRSFNISRDGCALLIMGTTGQKALGFKLAYIARFNEMEAELLSQRQITQGLSMPL